MHRQIASYGLSTSNFFRMPSTLTTAPLHWRSEKEEDHGLQAEMGVSFSRTVDQIADGYSVKVIMDSDHCSTEDDYGSNDCHYFWAEVIHALSSIQVPSDKPLVESDMLVGKFTVDYILTYNFACHICGEPCVLTIPVIEQEISFPAPPCPLTSDDAPNPIDVPLDETSPTKGIPSHAEGEVYVQRSNGDIVVHATVQVTIR